MKRVRVIVTLVLLLTFTACGNGEKSSDSLSELGYQYEDTDAAIVTSKDTVSFHILSPKNALALDYNDMKVFQDLYDQTNVNVEWENLSDSAYATRKNLIMADKEKWPDAIYHAGFTEKEITLYASRDIIINIADYLDYMPNLFQIFEERPDILRLMKSPDGGIYSLPRIEEMGLLPYPNLLFLNRVWTEKLIDEGDIDFLVKEDLVDGLNLTLDQYYQILTKFNELDMNGNGKADDELPLSFVYQNWQGNQSDLYGAFGVPENVDHRTLIDGKVTSTVRMEAWREATDYFAGWVQEGLIDKEVFSQSQDQFLAKGKSTDQKLGSFYWWESETVVVNPEDYINLNPLTGFGGQQYIGIANSPEVSKGNFIVFSKTENPEILLSYIDRFYDPMISAQINYGPIGVVYEEELDEDGMLVQKAIPEGMTADELRLKNAPLGLIYLSDYHWENIVHMEPRAKLRVERLDERAKPFVYPGAEPIPVLPYTIEEINTLKSIEQNVDDYVYQQQTKYLLEGGITQEEYEIFMTTLESVGQLEAIEIYQNAYDRLKQQ